ncbi:PRC-barrel domain containing protein [Alteromonas aestuariivivens]|uniref:PRC-barrel domain containing protein n=1 Tax=Alteromonas aestuariivivens TaxID=1938339 RepID=A0A3D8M4I1_9ALTE|nr:PRC-barrel domain-containing protein [Alteromonas aestuariivivens]RDV24455.1 PRC-barrel domain containing protein [Alteromonas aestuariivivens]
MMITYRQLDHCAIHATDGDIGGCRDVLFDDQDFVVRYLVADTNTWLPLSRKVVLSPISITELNKEEHKVHVAMTRQELKDSPSIEEHKPVSREYEEMLFKYFGYGYYWIGPGAWGDFAHPTELVDAELDKSREQSEPQKPENHMRSCSEIIGYDLATLDGEIGHISDFLVEESGWQIKALVVDTHNWLPGGKKLLLMPADILSFDWSTHKVNVNLAREALLARPEIETDRLDDPAYRKHLLEQLGKSQTPPQN